MASAAETEKTETAENLKKKGRLRKVHEEFIAFLWEYSVMGLAIGVIIGGAVNTFVQSLVTGIITPLLQMIIPSGAFKDLSYRYNGVVFSFGPLLSSFLNLIIVSFIIFFSIKFLLFHGGKIEREKISRT